MNITIAAAGLVEYDNSGTYAEISGQTDPAKMVAWTGALSKILSTTSAQTLDAATIALGTNASKYLVCVCSIPASSTGTVSTLTVNLTAKSDKSTSGVDVVKPIQVYNIADNTTWTDLGANNAAETPTAINQTTYTTLSWTGDISSSWNMSPSDATILLKAGKFGLIVQVQDQTNNANINCYGLSATVTGVSNGQRLSRSRGRPGVLLGR